MNIIRTLLQKCGLDLIRHSPERNDPLRDLSEVEKRILGKVRPFTMTSVERIAALINAVQYCVRHEIPGAMVECGVWRGGSMMAIAETLIAAGDTSRHLYLYDTFEGMNEPTEVDKTYYGQSASEQMQNTPKGEGVWCCAGIDDVRANVLSTGYPEKNIHFIKGKVEETIPHATQGRIALLRLDTDWYESTKQELTYLYPLLESKGVLIVDDYGSWAGAKKAVDEYLLENKVMAFLHRIDFTGRLAIKP